MRRSSGSDALSGRNISTGIALSSAFRFDTAPRLTLIEPEGAHFRLHLEVRTASGVEHRVETARKIILGNGVAGNGGRISCRRSGAAGDASRAYVAMPSISPRSRASPWR